jgi:MFS family permease
MAFLSALTPILVGLIHSPWSLYNSAFFVAAAGQSMKVTNDALIQSKITDDFRGRTFAFYDMTVNVGIVSSALLAALFTPDTGIAPAVGTAITLVYLFVAIVILRPSKFSGISTN